MARTLLIAVCLAAASTGSATTAADRFTAEQEWRYSVIDRYARQATQQRISFDQWIQSCRQIRAEIERAGKWQKGWPLPQRMRDIGFNDWEIGWMEILFLDAGYTNPTRDKDAPQSPYIHHRFHNPGDAQRAGYHTRQVTT